MEEIYSGIYRVDQSELHDLILQSSSCSGSLLVTLCSHKSGRCTVELYHCMPLISGTLRSSPLPWLPVLSNIEPPALRRKAATDKLVEKIVEHDCWPMQPYILSPPLLRLTSRKPLWLDLQPVNIKVDGGITGSRLRWSILT